MSSQSLQGLALVGLGLLLVCFSDLVPIASYSVVIWGGFLFMRGLSEGSGE